MYIITEDSNSARDFWQCVAQTFRSVDSFLLVSFPIGSDGQTASGNTTLKAQVLSIFPKLQAGDKVFVTEDDLLVKAVSYGEYKWFSLSEMWDTGYDKKGGMILYHI